MLFTRCSGALKIFYHGMIPTNNQQASEKREEDSVSSQQLRTDEK